MKIIIAALLVSLAVASLHPVNHEMVAQIKQKASTWTPMEVEENPFAYMPIEQIKGMMGTKLTVVNAKPIDYGFAPDANFDGREAWGTKVHPIRDQGQCGSCWAFGATEALSDRFAIEKNVDVILSPQHLVSCDKNNYGCNGGYLFYAWQFMQKTGVMTEECYPYTSGKTQVDGDCFTTCADGSAPVFYHAGGYKAAGSVLETQQAIQEQGPVEAAFTVYADFMNYKSGVYQHTSGGLLGGHAIKCIGWGTEAGVDYWLMANSWDTTWGDNGFFKIKRGDCGVDSQMYYALADSTESLVTM